MTQETTNNPFDNQEFRKEFEETLDKKLSPLVKKVDDHEEAIQQARGAKWLAMAFWGVIAGALEYFLHRK